nr:LamG-like jellyroll fold domain-containing protein [Rhodoferax sp.]
MAARYWRISAIRTASGSLALADMALSDGTTNYSSAPLSGVLSAGFKIVWDLGAAVEIVQLRIMSITEPDFPTSVFLESGTDGVTWDPQTTYETITYPGDATTAAIDFGDLNASTCILLLHADGADGSTVIVDSSPSGNTVVAMGTTALSTAQQKFGASSLYFAGGNNPVYILGGSNFAFGTLDYSVEFFYWPANFSSLYVLIDFRGNGQNGYYPYLDIDTSGRIHFYAAGAYQINPTTPLTLNAQNHIALCRVSGVTTIYINGTASGTPWPNAGSMLVGFNCPTIGGSAWGGPYSPVGYFDEVAILKGVSHYTANFTPPVVPVFSEIRSGTTAPVIYGVMQTSGVVHQGDGGARPDGCTSCASSGAIAIDMIDGGTAHLTGTVAEKNTPTNTPLSRRVALIDEATRRTIRETWSNDNGDYTFPDIADRTYTVLAYDHTHAYRAVVADNLAPTP